MFLRNQIKIYVHHDIYRFKAAKYKELSVISISKDFLTGACQSHLNRNKPWIYLHICRWTLHIIIAIHN